MIQNELILNRNILTDIRKQIYGYQQGSEGGIYWEFGFNIHTTTIYEIDIQNLTCIPQGTIFNIL